MNKIVCFGEEITRTEVVNPKTVLSSSLGGDVGFRDIIITVVIITITTTTIFHAIERQSNDQAYGKLSGNKDW
jgi:hypothetical protein